MVERKKPPSLVPIARLKLHPSVHPTVEMWSFDGPRIQEAILGVFRRFGYTAIDLEALIFLSLQRFDVTPATFEYMQKTMKDYIMTNFAIQQGSYLRLAEVNMRRITVCYTIDQSQE